MNMLPSMLIAATLIGGSLQVNIPYVGNNAGTGCKPELPEATEGVQGQYSAGNIQELLERLQKLGIDTSFIENCLKPIICPGGENPPEERPVEKPDEKPDENPEGKPDEKPEEKPDESPEEKPEEKPDESSEENPDEQPEEKPEEQPEEKPDEKPEEKPEESPEEKPEQKPDVPEDDSADKKESEVLSFAEQVVELVNAERAKVNLPALTMTTKLNEAALVRAKETVQSFSHTRPNGSSFSTVLKENGISFQGAGENIAWGQRTPEQVVLAWMNSEGHRANILNPKYTSIGVGYYLNGATPYWAQLFTY